MLKYALFFVVLCAALLYGVIHLFALRFATGDVFPPYSSLRTDPLGVKGLHDALRELPGLQVERNYRPIAKLHSPTAPTVFYTGIPHEAFCDNEELKTWEKLLHDGARIVIAFHPVARGPTVREADRKTTEERRRKRERLENEKEKKKEIEKSTEAKKEPASEKSESEENEDDEEKMISLEAVAQRWGCAFKFFPGEATFHREALLVASVTGFAPRLGWHSALHFALENDEWKTIYACETQPVIIERSFGNGSVVFVADAYPLSNEAMRNEREAKLLAWLVGSSSKIVFDEESHGVRSEPGIVSLIRKYRLQGAVAALLCVALLFVWKNASPLVPPYADRETDAQEVIGKCAGEGFINLLRRSIAPGEILQVCVREWKKSCDQGGSRGGQVEQMSSPEESRRDPVHAYRMISRALAKR